MLNRIRYRISKDEQGTVKVLKPRVLARDLAQLQAGEYDVVVQLRDPRLLRMKRYYFRMEQSLAEYLGYEKDAFHAAIATQAAIGRTVDIDSGEVIYESIAEIDDPQRMFYRIIEFQHWAAREFDYTFDPYKDDTDATPPTSEFPAD